MQNGLFWAVVMGLAAMVGLVLVQALRRGSVETSHPDIGVYRDQLAEVDRDLERGVLSEEEAKRLRNEVSRRLLDADAMAKKLTPVAQGKIWLPLSAVLLALVGSLALYQRLGAPGYGDFSLSSRLALADEAYRTRPSQEVAEAGVTAEAPVKVDDDFLALMEKLRAAVAERPDEPQGLILLARNEAALGNFKAAHRAQAHLVDTLGEKATPEQRLTVAQMMIAAAGGYVSPEAESYLVAVLADDPRNPMARYFSGLMFGQIGRPDRAFTLWQPLMDEGPADAPWVEAIRADLPAVAEAAGIKYQLPDTLKGPGEADVAAAAAMTETERKEMIATMVEQLETRLLAEGGSVEEWVRLMTVMGVLGDAERGRAGFAAAQKALAGDPAGLAQVEAAAKASGFAP